MRAHRLAACPWRLAHVALAVAACGRAATPAPRPAAPPPVAPLPPVAPPSPTATLAPSPAPSPPSASSPALADGRYWTRRVTSELRRGSEGVGLDGPGASWVELRTACVALDLGRDGARRTVAIARAAALTPSPAVAADDGVVFRLDADPATPDAWRLTAPRLTRAQPAIELTGTCTADLTGTPLPVFATRDACLAAPTIATRLCQGDRCRFDGPAPLWLAGCEDELRRLGLAAEPIVAASHREQLRSVERLSRVATRGGQLWWADEDDGRCYPLVATPGRDDRLRLRDVHAIPGGGKVTYQAEVVLEPLFRRARFASESRVSEGPHAGGARGIGDFTVGLYVGRDAVLVGARWIYFDRATCRRAAAPLADLAP